MGGFDVLSSVVSTQIELHAEFGGVVPEIASRAHLDVLNPVVARAIVEAGVDESADRRRGVHGRPGPDRRPAGRRVGGQGAGAGVGRARSSAVNHLEAHLYSAFLEDPDARVPARGAARVGRPHDAGRDAGPRRLPPARPDDRRRRGRGVRQGRPLPRPRLSRRAGDRPCRAASAIPAAIAFPRAMLRRRVSTSASAGSRRRWSTTCRKHPDVGVGRRGGVVPDGGRRRAGRQGRRAAAEVGATGIVLGGGVAAELVAARADPRRVRARTGSQGFLPSRAMCTDNAAMIAAAGWHRLRSRRSEPARRRRHAQPPPRLHPLTRSQFTSLRMAEFGREPTPSLFWQQLCRTGFVAPRPRIRGATSGVSGSTHARWPPPSGHPSWRHSERGELVCPSATVERRIRREVNSARVEHVPTLRG